MADLLIEVLAGAGEICMLAGRWFYPGDKRTAASFAAGCLVLFVGMMLVGVFAVFGFWYYLLGGR